MPILIFNNSSGLVGGILNSRVLIGRNLTYGISLPDNSVSRLHAWIDPVADENAPWVITDAGSKTGTFVNDVTIAHHALRTGDVIRVGTYSLTYLDDEQLPDGTHPIELIAPPAVVRGAGILFECSCGSPLWVDNKLAGKRGVCRHCRKPVTVPALSDQVHFDVPDSSATAPATTPATATAPPPTAPAPQVTAAGTKRKTKCAVCHAPITAGEEMTTCPDCAMTFHTECWQENLGCSSYGCPQVNCLARDHEPEVATEAVDTGGTESIEEPAQSRLEVMLLAGSVVAGVLGAAAFARFPLCLPSSRWARC